MSLTTSPEATRSQTTPRPVLLLTGLLALLAVVVTFTAEMVAPAADPPSLLVLLGLLVALLVAGSLNLEYHVRGQTAAFDHFEAALVPALYFLPPWLVVALAAIAKIISQVRRRVRPVKAAFNVIQWSAAAAVGALTFAWAAGLGTGERRLLAVAVAVLATVVVNALAILAMLSLVQQRPPGQRLPAGAVAILRSTALTGLINIAFGVLFVATATTAPIAAPLLLVPLAALHWASRGYAVARVEETRLRTTRLAVTALGADADWEAALGRFLAAVGYGMHRDVVDLAVRVPNGLEVRRWRRDGPAVAVELPLDQAGTLLPALLGLEQPVQLDAAHGDLHLRRLLRNDGYRDCAAAPVRVTGEVDGVLAFYDARSPVTLPERELTIIAELAREVGLARERAGLLGTVVEERAKMSQIVNDIRDGIVTLGAEGKVHTWNPALERITGFSAAELVGTTRLGRLDPRDVAGRRIRFDRWPSLLDQAPADVHIRTKDGARRWLSCSYAQGNDDSGRLNRLIVMARDVTELKHIEGRLAEQTAVLELIASGEPVEVSLELLARDLAASDEGLACAVLLTSRTDPDLLEGVALAGIDVAVLEALDALRVGADAGWPGRAVEARRGVFVDDIEIDPGSRSVRAVARVHGIRACSAVPIRAPDGDRVIGALVVLSPQPRPDAEARDHDLLERAAHLAAVAVARSEFEAQLAHQATHDALTGLPNRVLLIDRTARALSALTEDSIAVMVFVDLDRFKLINDSMGHEAGDQLLVEIGDRLRSAVRDGDTVARFGGDEFTILAVGTGDAAFLDLARRIQGVFTAPFTLGGNDVVVSASIGVALGGPATEADELVNDADAAMYRAKERGGNRYELYESSMRGPAMLNLVTHNALHLALDRGELVLVYQPIIDLRSGSMEAVEALVRWRHPQRGLLLPEAFLPLAERTGLIQPIGEFVVLTALAQAHEWRTAGPDGGPLAVNVNLSARELGQADLAGSVADAIAATGVDPASIRFEITESALLHDLDATRATLWQLKGLGVGLSIDDFGTGYAPLTYLRRFPVDGLKIDRSFVSGLEAERADRAIVAAVIGLAHALDLTATAEGVETERQLAALRELGCDAAQGFYLAPPVLAHELVPELALVMSPATHRPETSST
ncbi:MAG: EAL domain-containing protein [Sporichthyaceae bacterium]|nr:EAL domain-containing protein [Sporichthyaceae bacterium]